MEGLLRYVYESKKLSRGLRLVSHGAGFIAFWVFCFVATRTALISPFSALKLCAIIGLSYIIVSAARRFIDAPRPYEIYEFYESAPKDKKGVSFPSRHTFLMFAIATAVAPSAPISASALAILGLLLATARVLLGIHFIRDVLCGALLGIISSALGLLILSPF
jgi:membrane-associated phospholipid phosphatase